MQRGRGFTAAARLLQQMEAELPPPPPPPAPAQANDGSFLERFKLEQAKKVSRLRL
jgi:hypothetical protein